MKILTLDEGKAWLSNRSLSQIFSKQLDELFSLSAMFEFPKDMGQATSLVKGLASQFTSKESQSYLWIVDWAAWPSQSNLDLFYGYRRSLGEERRLINAPFHILEKSETSKLESLLGLCVYFYWDAIVGNVDGNISLSTSNDEVFDLYANRLEDLEAFQNVFSICEIKRLIDEE